MRKWCNALIGDLAPFRYSGGYVNFNLEETDAADSIVFGDDLAAQLNEVREKYDSRGAFSAGVDWK